MGSQSDYKTMKNCEKVLKILKVNYETNIVSAHRTPDRLYNYAKKAENNNITIIIAGAGGAALGGCGPPGWPGPPSAGRHRAPAAAWWPAPRPRLPVG